MTALQVDRSITVDIEKLVYGGEGLARYASRVVLVPRGIPGDRLVVRIAEIKAECVHAEIEEIVRPSPLRIHPECQGFHDGCGGCQWLHISYAGQLAWKKRIVEDTLRRYDTLKDVAVHDVVGMEYPFFYRNKLVVRVRGKQDNLRVGFHAPRTRWLINIFNREGGQCYIQRPLNNRLASGLAASLTRNRLPLKSGTIRTSDEGEVTLDLDRRLTASIASDLQGIGRQTPHVHYTIKGRRFRVTSPSFFQANTDQTGPLVDAVLAMLPERLSAVIDLYGGVGLFSLFLAERADFVYGVEESSSALGDARHNAAVQGRTNIRFLPGKAEDILPEITAGLDRVDAILVDPPRAGCDAGVLETIGRCRPDRLVYVSCNVTTLARDLAVLYDYGLIATEVRPVDMFPHTYHIECVTQCIRR